MRPGDGSLSGWRRRLGGSFQRPRSDGRAVGDAAGKACEGAAAPEVLTKGPGRRPVRRTGNGGSRLCKHSEVSMPAWALPRWPCRLYLRDCREAWLLRTENKRDIFPCADLGHLPITHLPESV